MSESPSAHQADNVTHTAVNMVWLENTDTDTAGNGHSMLTVIVRLMPPEI